MANTQLQDAIREFRPKKTFIVGYKATITEAERLNRACKALGVSKVSFVWHAVSSKVDEFLGKPTN